MNLSAILDTIIKLLTIVAAKTPTTADDRILDLLTAVRDSPALLDWINGLLVKTGTSSTMQQIDFQDPELSAAFDASPKVKQWTLPKNGDKQNLGVADLAALIKYLPMIIELIRAFKNTNAGK